MELSNSRLLILVIMSNVIRQSKEEVWTADIFVGHLTLIEGLTFLICAHVIKND